MKKKLIVLIISIQIVAIIGVTIVLTSKNERLVKGYDYLYDIAIEYLENDINANYPNKENLNNFKSFFDYTKYGITQETGKKFAYMMVKNENYYEDNGNVISDSGSVTFYKFTFKNGNVINMEMPNDGNLYAKSLKKLCMNNKMYKKVLKDEHNFNIEEEVNKYYNINK